MNDIHKDDAKRTPWLTVERLGAIADGVIAIIITILVLGIEVPESHDFKAEGAVSLVQKFARDIMVYLLSFALIWVYWLQHHVIFHYVARTDRPLVFFNGLFLFLLSLSPFTTKLAGTYRGETFAEVVFIKPVEKFFVDKWLAVECEGTLLIQWWTIHVNLPKPQLNLFDQIGG